MQYSMRCCMTDIFTQPLRVMLSYESGQLVQQQQIMFLSPDSRISILTNDDDSLGAHILCMPVCIYMYVCLQSNK